MYSPFFAILLCSNLFAQTFDSGQWLLWHSTTTTLPYTSSLTIYPPVNLTSNHGSIIGSIAVPYKSKHNSINDFLVVVKDHSGKSHILQPKVESVGFVDGQGIFLSALHSDSFTNGDVKIELYKVSSEENKKELELRNAKRIKKQRGVDKALVTLPITKPKLNEKWAFEGTTLNNESFDSIIAGAEYIAIQLYNPSCGFCKESIPFNNDLNKSKDIRVIGLVGVKDNRKLQQHLSDANVKYPFISYEGEYTESALLKAVGQQGTPTYFVMDKNKILKGVFGGTPNFQKWLKSNGIKSQKQSEKEAGSR